MHHEDYCEVIDVLKKGDIIGYKSILFDAAYQFSAIVIENVRIYNLKKSYFDIYKNKIQGLNDIRITA